MKLGVDLSVYRKIRSFYSSTSYEYLKKIDKASVSAIRIYIDEQHLIECYLKVGRSYSKFRRTSENIIHVLNLNSTQIRVSKEVWIRWTPYDLTEYHEKLEIDSSYLLSNLTIPSSYDRNLVINLLEKKRLKTYVTKPRKEKSQMEYRKRAYYGKCKK